MLDYEILRLIWWVLLGVLLMGFAIMDGFDLGVAICLPWLAKTDEERRILINSIGPTWEGNQVWFILGGGAIFAAWPILYGLSFSGFYLAMLVVLLALILRPVGFKYRSKLSNILWRQSWDLALFIGGFVPALIFGVAIGNVLQGVPFHFDADLRPYYTGSFFALLNPYALLCGLLSVVMLTMHGANFINIKTSSVLRQRAVSTIRTTSLLTMVLFFIGGLGLLEHVPGYVLNSAVDHDGPSNPLHKHVILQSGAYLKNYFHCPLLIIIPSLGFLGAILSFILSGRHRLLAFISSATSIVGMIGSVGVSMFPFILPSSSQPNHSLMIWDSSSSELTLKIMLIATVIFFPIIIGYTAWVYRVLRGEINLKSILANEESSY